jgi:maltose O-acetyltransferase
VSEREKMLAGEPYDPFDPELAAARRRAQETVIAFNGEPDEGRRLQMLGELLGSFGERSEIVPPFFCDYGANLHLGYDSFVNTNSVFLDCAEITIGDHARLGPGVQVLAADHPREPELRAADVELAAPVRIGARTWIGAGTIVCPGVTIGEHSIVGAGSVVVRDVPERVMAAGNPCRVIREL